VLRAPVRLDAAIDVGSRLRTTATKHGSSPRLTSLGQLQRPRASSSSLQAVPRSSTAQGHFDLWTGCHLTAAAACKAPNRSQRWLVVKRLAGKQLFTSRMSGPRVSIRGLR
jgi:hypothetical protein